MISIDVDTAVVVPVNAVQLTDDTDYKTRETGVAYNAAGMDLTWNFVTSAGVVTQTAVTPTTGGVYDWTHVGDAMYTIEIPASGGASINNDAEGYGYFTGYATGVLPWRGPTMRFRAAALNDALCDGGDNLDVNLVQWVGTAPLALSSQRVQTSVAAMASGVITAASIASNAITSAKFASGAFDAVWTVTTRVVTAATNITSTGGTTVPQTGDSYARIGAAGASLTDLGGMSTAMKAEVNAEADLALTDYDPPTRTEATADKDEIITQGDSAWTTGAGGTPPDLLQTTTIATLSSQTSFTLTAGSADDDAYNDCMAIVTDQSIATQKCVGWVSDYTGSSKTVTLNADPAVFTMATGDTIAIVAIPRQLDAAVSAGGGLDAAGTRAALGMSSANLDSQLSTIDGNVDSVLADTNELQTDWADGGRLDLLLDATSTHSASAVWSVATRVLTANTNLNDPTVADIVNGTWNEPRSSHVTAGTFGQGLDARVSLVGTPTSIASAVWDTTTSAHVTSGTFGFNLDARVSLANTSTPPTAAENRAEMDSNSTQLAAIVTDTGTTLPALLPAALVSGRMDCYVGAKGSSVGLSTQEAADVNTEVDTALTDVSLETVDARLPAALVSGRMDSNTSAINDSNAAAARLALSAGQIIPFTVDTVTNTHTPTTTEFQADDVTEATADHFNGRIVIWTSGALAGLATDITDYAQVGGIGQFTVTAMVGAPANNDSGIIV